MIKWGVNKQRLFIITGLPYSGKTTLVNELVRRFDFTVVSVDEVLDENNFVVEKMTQDDWNVAYTIAYDRLKKYLKEGKTVIFDGGSLKRSERNTKRAIAESLGVEHKLIFVDTPIEEIVKRRLRNMETKERGHLEEETMKVAYDMFERPTDDENPIIYRMDMNLDKWMEHFVA
jgi:predicted kinase